MQLLLRGVQELSGAMEMAPAFALAFNLDSLQDLRLQRSTKPLYGPEAICLGSLLSSSSERRPSSL